MDYIPFQMNFVSRYSRQGRRILHSDDPGSALSWPGVHGMKWVWPDWRGWASPGARLRVVEVHNLQAGLCAGKNCSGGYVFMWAKNALNPTFCVCIFLYLFIIIANVYFNVQISAKYDAQKFKFFFKFL